MSNRNLIIWTNTNTPAHPPLPTIGMPVGELEAPDSIEPLVLYRSWRVDWDGTLVSCNWEHRWPGKQPLEAACKGWGPLRGMHPAPQRSCSCGIYAAADPGTLFNYITQGLNSWSHTTAVAFGPVKLWGRVVRAERGARAQFAYPAGLVVLTTPSFEPWPTEYKLPLLERVAHRYGVQTKTINQPLTSESRLDRALHYRNDE